MSLRTRLVVSTTALLLVVIAAVGLAASRSVRAILLDQVDGSLVAIAERRGFPRPDTEPSASDAIVFRSIAEVHVSASGQLVYSRPSGYIDDPDELPDLGGVERAEGLGYVPSVDGAVQYRTYLDIRRDGSLSFYAAPMTPVTLAISSLVARLVTTGGLVLLVGAAATWLTVRSATRPVDEMIEAAAAIADGDLARRVPDLDPSTELGQLSVALNKMLIKIEEGVTAERAARERLRQFVADASHELRTPLTTIIGYAELRGRSGEAFTEVEEQAWERIESESRRMARLTEDLLTLARLGHAQELEHAAVDLVAVGRGLVDDHQTVDPQRPIDLVAPDAMVVEGDAERLHQVLSNLIANTRVHTPPGTRVEVRIDGDDRVATMTVTDTGPGIPADSLDSVFERFYRADKSRARQSGGSGLGLAIVRAIVDAHGGTVTAGNAPGGGAQFTVELPRRSPAG